MVDEQPDVLGAGGWELFWADCKKTAVVLGILAALIWCTCWVGLRVVLLLLVCAGVIYLGPFLLLAFVVFLWESLSAKPGPRWTPGARIMLQVVLLLLALIPVGVVGGYFEALSRQVTFSRADVIIAAVQAYRERHGEYPESLATVEKELGHPLPRPTFLVNFNYHGDKDGYDLSFPGQGFFEWWYYSSEEKEWYIED
jgi:hypothetical protein